MNAALERTLHPLTYLQGTELADLGRDDSRSVWLDHHLADRYAEELPEQKQILARSTEHGLPPMQIGPFEGHLVSIFLTLMKAKRGIEIGTLGGYSASWICRAIASQADAHLDTLEINPEFAKVAELNLAPWRELVQVRPGSAFNTLERDLYASRDLDFVFIDADKASYPLYFDWAWPRIRTGGVILLDNFYLRGGVYFDHVKDFPKDFIEKRSAGERFTETQWRAMKCLWQRLEDLGAAAQKTILPTSKGLGLVIKN